MENRGLLLSDPNREYEVAVTSMSEAVCRWHESVDDEKEDISIESDKQDLQLKLDSTLKQGKMVILVLIIIITVLIFE